MKLTYILLVGALLMCGSGIAAADDDDPDMSKMVDMGKVKTHAMSFWDTMNKDSNVGYLILGAALTVAIIIILGVLFIGSGKSALGTKSGDSNATNEGRGNVTDAVKATAGLVLGILVVMVLLGLL